MSLTDLKKDFGQGGSGLTDGRLSKALRELQSLKTVVVDGAAADTNIPVSGIKTTDTIQSAVGFNAGVPADHTSTFSITSAGNVRCSANTTGEKITLSYYVKP